MTETNPAILNDGAVANNTALEPDEIEKNIRIIITKLKGKYMNEGRISMLDNIVLFFATDTCHITTKPRVSAGLDTVSKYTIDIDHGISPDLAKLATI